jgi:hypothetical protein
MIWTLLCSMRTGEIKAACLLYLSSFEAKQEIGTLSLQAL